MQTIKNINFDYENSNIEIEYVEEDTIYDHPISFEELCDISDNSKVDENENLLPLQSPTNEKIPSDKIVIIHKYDHQVKSEILEKEFEISARVKRMSTTRLKAIFKSVRKYECSDLYDRQLLIHTIASFYSSGEYEEALAQVTFYITRLDKVEVNKLSWQDIKEIKRLYSIKVYNIIEVKNELEETIEFKKVLSKDSAYSFKEIGDIFKLSHIFTRNICLGKVYKNS